MEHVPGQQGCRGVGFTQVQAIHGVESGHSLDLAQVPKPNISIGTGNGDRGLIYENQWKEKRGSGGTGGQLVGMERADRCGGRGRGEGSDKTHLKATTICRLKKRFTCEHSASRPIVLHSQTYIHVPCTDMCKAIYI